MMKYQSDPIYPQKVHVDPISDEFLKAVCSQLGPIVTAISRASLREGYVPVEFWRGINQTCAIHSPIDWLIISACWLLPTGTFTFRGVSEV